MSPNAVECRRLGRVFESAGGRGVAAVDGLDFVIHRSEVVCLIGPTGCGKTTALRMIGGLLAPDSGEVAIGTDDRGRRLRRAIVFQEHGLFPWMSVIDNVAFGLEARGLGRDERRRRAALLVESMGLGPFASALPHRLSVGMRQRAGVARALLTDPDILLMDEPFGSLDAQTRRLLQDELLAIWASTPKTVLFVTHDIEEAVRLGDRVLVMSARPGRIVDSVEVAIERPRDATADRRSRMAELEDRLWQLLERPARDSLDPEPGA
jgi:NitT/TauT family transport system ATP-binding protein